MTSAKFTADIGTIAVGAKNVKVVLTLSKKDFFRNAAFFESEPSDVEVSLGDPQMTMDEYARQQAEREQATRTTYNVAKDGTVEDVQHEGDGEQSEMFDDTDPDLPDEVYEELPGDEIGFEFPDEESGNADPADEHTEGSTTEGSEIETAAIDKEALEEFILTERPAFEDIPYDFPNLLERKKSGEKWIEIAKAMNVPSSTLQTAYGKYKTRVRSLIAGAAS